MVTVKSLENCKYWQQVVLNQSRDPAQQARAKAAIERLQAQIDALKQETASCKQ